MKEDLKKTLPSYAAASGRYDIVEIPPPRYLAMDATGAPKKLRTIVRQPAVR